MVLPGLKGQPARRFFCRRWYIQEHIALKDKRGIWSLNKYKNTLAMGKLNNNLIK